MLRVMAYRFGTDSDTVGEGLRKGVFLYEERMGMLDWLLLSILLR